MDIGFTLLALFLDPHQQPIQVGVLFFLGIEFALVKQLVGVDIGFTPLAVRWPPLAFWRLVGGGSFFHPSMLPTYGANRHGRCIYVYPAKLHDNLLIFCANASCKVR